MRSTKLTYEEYKVLESALSGGAFMEVTQRTVDETAYRKTIVLNLAGRELRFVGPWKHAGNVYTDTKVALPDTQFGGK